MQFDVFHSLARIDSVSPRLSDRQVFELFFSQLEAAEDLGFGTMWVAESHFSSELQKAGRQPVIPHFAGEVGLNCDSIQLAQLVLERTRKIGFGTAIMNIVGGNGGPIAAADRVRMLAWYNALRAAPRRLDIGIAQGRFPYINQPFGITPRSASERALWPQVQNLIFLEALEIFLRLSCGEAIGDGDISRQVIGPAMFRDLAAWESKCAELATLGLRPDPLTGGFVIEPRWRFDRLELVPAMTTQDWQGFLRFVLGSHDPKARELGMRFADLDIFNLSFTPPATIENTHREMQECCARLGRSWQRSRMPRTVLVFLDDDAAAAHERASQCLDIYMEAMRGTAAFPPKDVLLQRALVGDAAMIVEQLGANNPRGFKPEDRLMLWFEFNQADGDAIIDQMRRFAEDVIPHING